MMRCVSARALTGGGGAAGTGARTVCHIELQPLSPCDYTPGDHLEVGCTQSEETVLHLCCRLGINGSSCVALVGAYALLEPPAPGVLPSGCLAGVVYVVGDMLKTRDLAVTRDMLGRLARHCYCPEERAWLQLCARDAEEYASKMHCLTLSELLDTYSSLQFGLDVLLAATAPLRRRYYSISSSPPVTAAAAGPPQLSITVGVVDECRAENLVRKYETSPCLFCLYCR